MVSCNRNRLRLIRHLKREFIRRLWGEGVLTELKGKLRNQAEKPDLERTGAGTAFGPLARTGRWFLPVLPS